MKVTLVYSVLTFLFVIVAFAKKSEGQSVLDKKVTISIQNENFRSALRKISRTASITFSYSRNTIPDDDRVSVTANDQVLGVLFSTLFDPYHIGYEAIGNQVVLKRKSKMTSDLDAANMVIISEALPIKGIVRDDQGNPLVKVSVQVKGATIGTSTNEKGEFFLSVADDAVLIFSFVGFQTQEIKIAGKTSIEVTLQSNVSSLEDVVVVGYGTQKKTSLTASVSSVTGDQIMRSPVANISNTLGGRMSGVLTRQSSGEPGKDADKIQIRGIGTTGNADALVVVDGIPMNYDQLNPNEIETVTVLKDAAAVAPYGLAGANGVILVTTKRGKAGKLALNYNGYYGFQQPTRIPHYLDAYGYATQFNIANQNVGNAATYNDEALQKYKDGSDPDHFPNTDWVNEVINFHNPLTSHTLSFTGGNDKIHFYSDLGYLYQEGVVNVINFRRYNASVNVDAEVTNTTKVSLDVRGRLAQQRNPAGRNGTAIFTDITEIAPTLPLKFANGLPAHTMLPSIYNSGYNRSTGNFLNAKFQVEQKLPFIPGLSLKGVFAYEKNNTLGKVWSTPYDFYSLDAQNSFITQHGGPPSPTLSQSFAEEQNITLQGYATYKQSFGKSDIGALVVYERRTGANNNFAAGRINYAVNLDELSLGSTNTADFSNSGSSSRSAQIGWVYRLNYAYNSKYLLELTGRYDGHYYFAPGKRYAFFPAISAGWRLSEESFIKDNYPWIDNLKIRGSYGKSGNLAGGPFQYLTAYGLGPSYILGGTSSFQTQGIFENAQPNPNITWETAKKADIGLDITLFRGQIDFSIDYFKERRSDMLLKPTEVIPVEYGIGISQENAGIMENSGIDFSIGTNQRFANGIRLNASFNFSYAKNKLIQTFENASTYNNPNRRLTGRPLNTQFGLKALGFYQPDDFNPDGTLKNGEPVPTYGPIAPGDIKYADLAGAPGADGKPTGPDGIININDYTVIGHPLFPQIIFGLNTALSWKGIDLYMLWQGAGSSTYYVLDELASPFFNGAKIASYQLDYWTPEHPNARFPRLTPAVITNNAQTSSFWTRNGTYLRLKTLELGYTLPPAIMNAIKLHSVRVFVSGQNVLTFSAESYIDPELGNNRARYYFQQKTYTVGLNVGF